MWNASFAKLLDGFPPHVKEAVSAGFSEYDRFWSGLKQVYAEHGCRVKPFPVEMEYTLLQIYGKDADRTVHNAG